MYPGNPNKLKACIDCGNLFRKRDLSYKGLCHDCQWKRMKEAARQIHEKKGPLWERRIEGYKRYIKRITGE